MKFSNIAILTEDFEVRDHVDVDISQDRIAAISDSEETGDSQYLMMPGFYNAHGHSPMSLMRGYGENLNLQDWLFTKIFPFEDKLTPEAVYYGTLLSMAESFKYGIVSTSDMYYFVDDMVRAVKESGAKANISRALANPEGLPFDQLESLKEMMDAVDKYNGAENNRIIIDSALHAEYTSNEDTAVELAKLTKKLNLRMHVHVAETRLETQECKERHQGKSPVRYLADCGIFDQPSIAAHCVWIDEEDIRILKEYDVNVATNPVSNLKLASGICDVSALLEEGVQVALGTDSSASNNNLNMFEELKTMNLLAKIKHNDPRVLSAKDSLTIATRNGALAQGRWDCGLIKEGFKADFIVIRKTSPNLSPVYDMVNNIVLSATDSDIYMTVIDGQVVYQDGEFPTLDIEEIVEGANRSVKDILSSL